MPSTNQEIRLTTAATDIYMVTSAFALAIGVLSWTQYLMRLRFIRDSAESGSIQAAAANQALSTEDMDLEEEWPIGAPAQLESQSEPAESQLSVPDDARPNVLHFLAAGSIGLPQWRFRLGDPDFFPSIPHGHWCSDNKKKLDAYRGWIFGKTSRSTASPDGR